MVSSNITKYAEELQRHLNATGIAEVSVHENTVEDSIVFALEKDLEDSLVKN